MAAHVSVSISTSSAGAGGSHQIGDVGGEHIHSHSSSACISALVKLSIGLPPVLCFLLCRGYQKKPCCIVQSEDDATDVIAVL